MSLGYADRLKPKRNLGGQLGAQEFHQSLNDIESSVAELASWVRPATGCDQGLLSFDSRHIVGATRCTVAQQIAEAQRVFVFTGAGISTSCGIPDFRYVTRSQKGPSHAAQGPFGTAHRVLALRRASRGPKGIWTLRKRGEAVPSDFTPFEFARPSLTHQVRTKTWHRHSMVPPCGTPALGALLLPSP